jgi:hypothetical protein
VKTNRRFLTLPIVAGAVTIPCPLRHYIKPLALYIDVTVAAGPSSITWTFATQGLTVAKTSGGICDTGVTGASCFVHGYQNPTALDNIDPVTGAVAYSTNYALTVAPMPDMELESDITITAAASSGTVGAGTVLFECWQEIDTHAI